MNTSDHEARIVTILDATGERARLPERRTSDAAHLMDLSTQAGRRAVKSLVAAIGGGLLAGTVTGVLYGWGRLYYEGYLQALGFPASALSVPVADTLFAPFNTLFTTWMGIAGTVAALGILGMLGIAARAAARVFGGCLLRASSSRVQRVMRRISTPTHRAPSQDEATDDERFNSATRQAFAGLLLLIAGGAVALGGVAAWRDGKNDGQATLKSCALGERGTLTAEAPGPRSNFCARIGEEVIAFSPPTREVYITKWDKQRISAPVTHPRGR